METYHEYLPYDYPKKSPIPSDDVLKVRLINLIRKHFVFNRKTTDKLHTKPFGFRNSRNDHHQNDFAYVHMWSIVS